MLWPGFGIVGGGAKETVERGEDKELDVRERTTPDYAQRADREQLVRTSLAFCTYIYLFIPSFQHILQKYSSDQVSQVYFLCAHFCSLHKGVPFRVRGLSRTVGLQNIHSLGRPAHNESPNLHNLFISKSLMGRGLPRSETAAFNAVSSPSLLAR